MNNSDCYSSYNYADGFYEVVNIAFDDLPLIEKRKHSRIVEVRNGKVYFPEETYISIHTGEKLINREIQIGQFAFFKVNEVIEYLEKI